MKKYMIACVTVLAAVFSHAVELNWSITGSGSIGTVGDVSINFNEVTTIAVFYNTSSEWKLSSEGYTDMKAALAVAKDSYDATSSGLWGDNGGSGTFSLGTIDDSGNYFIVAFKNDGTYLQGNALSRTGETAKYFSSDGVTPPSTEMWNPAVGSNQWASAGVVPEPTSLALFALGVAAIGLRRRVKK